MIYIQLSEKYDAEGLRVLIKSGIPVQCLPANTYGVQNEQLKLLKSKKIPFKSLKQARFSYQNPPLPLEKV